MSIQENKEIARRCIAAFNEQDLHTLDELTAPEVYQQMREQLAWVQSTFGNHHLEITDMVAEGDKVWIRLASSGSSYTGGWRGIPASDTEWTNTGAFFMRLSGGKIVEGEQLFDVLNHLHQLGAKVVPAEEGGG